MPRLYCAGSSRGVAYYLDGGGSGYQSLPGGHTDIDAEYIAIIYGLTEYFNKWNKELDARQYDGDEMVATPSERTARPLPPPVLVCCSDENVVRILNEGRRHYIIDEMMKGIFWKWYYPPKSRLWKLARQVWSMSKNVEVDFQWCSRKENLAGKLLP